MRRTKPLRLTIGTLPITDDMGGDLDILGVGKEATEDAARQEQWQVSIKGSFRGVMNVSIGPRDDLSPGTEFRTLPRDPTPSAWQSGSFVKHPYASLNISAGSSRVSAHVTLSADTISVAQDGETLRGMRQGYLTLRFPDAFGSRGGLAWSVGAFSGRYGQAGPYGRNSGYYGTALYGKTKVAGESLTADIDLTDRFELLLEHGVGVTTDFIPYSVPRYSGTAVPYSTTKPPGAQFAHHAHAALWYDEWFKFGLHYLTSWTPSEGSLNRGTPAREGRITTMGADLHLDDGKFGNAYVGYGRMDAKNLFAVGEGLDVLHGNKGVDVKTAFFGRSTVVTPVQPLNDGGTVDTVLFQYIFSPSKVFGGKGALWRGTKIAAYGMYNHVLSPAAGQVGWFDMDVHKLKFGAEALVQATPWMLAGVRGDRVQQDLSESSDVFWAVAPRLAIKTRKGSREYVLLGWTHFFLGPNAWSTNKLQADHDIFSLQIVMSF